jgi:agmatine deiminase
MNANRRRLMQAACARIVQREVVLQEHEGSGASEEWSLDYFPPQERRRVGQRLWQVATASYLNFVVANGVVVLPDFVPHGTPPARQERVRNVFAAAFPGRRIEFVNAISAHWVGGGLHCASLNQPA